MKFLAIILNDDFSRNLEEEFFSGSNVYDLSKRAEAIISKELSKINDSVNGIVIGVACDLDIEKSWNIVMNYIPLKEEDLIFQFDLLEEDVVFADYENFMSYSLNQSPPLSRCFRDSFTNPSISFATNLTFSKAEKALIVGNTWNNNVIVNLKKDKSAKSKLINFVEKSSIWR